MTQVIEPSFVTGAIQINFWNVENNNDPGTFTGTPGTPPTGNIYRYVIIPGGVAGGKTTGIGGTNYNAEQLKAMPYNQVCRLFNIQP